MSYLWHTFLLRGFSEVKFRFVDDLNSIRTPELAAALFDLIRSPKSTKQVLLAADIKLKNVTVQLLKDI